MTADDESLVDDEATETDQETIEVDNEATETDPETIEVDNERRPGRRANPVALVVGLLYIAIGVGVLADHSWGGADLGAVAGAGAIVAGIAVIVLLIRR
jgi:hypothetical protein